MIRVVVWDLGGTLVDHPPDGQDLRPLDTYPELKLRLGAKEAVVEMVSCGYRQAVLSNTRVSDSAAVSRLLERLGIRRWFDGIWATQSEDLPSRPGKPEAAVFRWVLDGYGIRPEEAVMIGNSWDHDIVGAHRMGMHALWLQNPRVSARIDHSQRMGVPPWIVGVADVTDAPQTVTIIDRAERARTATSRSRQASSVEDGQPAAGQGRANSGDEGRPR